LTGSFKRGGEGGKKARSDESGMVKKSREAVGSKRRAKSYGRRGEGDQEGSLVIGARVRQLEVFVEQ